MEGILDLISKIPKELWDLLPALGIDGFWGHAIKAVIGLLGLTAVSRIIPDDWAYKPIVHVFDKLGFALYAPLFVIGKGVSEAGRKLLGKRRWEKVETEVFEKAIGLFFRALFDGLSLFFQRSRNGLLDGLDADDPRPGQTHSGDL